jgi:presenilin-like A22 family membrane protease
VTEARAKEAPPSAAEAAAEAATHAERPLGPPPVLAMTLMAGLFVVSIGLAMAIAPLYTPVFENPQDVGNAGLYLVFVVAFTAVILLIARYKLEWLIQAIILGAVGMSLVYLVGPLVGAAMGVNPVVPLPGQEGAANLAWGAGLVVAAALTLALWKYPEWWVVDTVGVGVSAGAGAYFGISFGLLPSLALLIGFAAYDAIAVYRTKHMIDLADKVMDLRLPIMLIVPKHRGYSFLREEAQLKEKLAKGEEREALFMGLGDVVIPCVLVVSALRFLDPAVMVAGVGGNLVVSLATLLGALAGYTLLMTLVAKGKAHAGLPSLNGGAILGFFLALLPLYGIAPLLP